ncbi:MAG: hypothetical protein ACOH5I_18795 [Oligoflexus sp.]
MAFSLLLGAWSNALAKSESGSRPLHHFFNARLLQPKEAQVSVYGNAKIGVLENLELGTQLIGYLAKPEIFNLSIKHRMFQGEGFQTSFNSHSIYFPGGENFSLGGLVSFHGVVTTWDLSQNSFLNFGLYDLYLYLQTEEKTESVRGHIFAPMIGYDLEITRKWALSFVLVQPVYAFTQANTDFGDIESELDFLQGGPENSSLFFMTTIISWGSFHLEPGVFGAGKTSGLYLNLFWRFYAG